jgi:hypothetical protein
MIFLLDLKLHQIERPPLLRRKAKKSVMFSVDDRLVDIEGTRIGEVGNLAYIANTDRLDELNQRLAQRIGFNHANRPIEGSSESPRVMLWNVIYVALQPGDLTRHSHVFRHSTEFACYFFNRNPIRLVHIDVGPSSQINRHGFGS